MGGMEGKGRQGGAESTREGRERNERVEYVKEEGKKKKIEEKN